MKKLSKEMITVLEEQEAIKDEISKRNPGASDIAISLMTQTAMRAIYQMGEEVFD